MISVTFENPCTFENVTELKNMELQGITKVSTPPPTPSEVQKHLKSLNSIHYIKMICHVTFAISVNLKLNKTYNKMHATLQ